MVIVRSLWLAGGPRLGGWLAADALGLVVLTPGERAVLSCVAIYAVGYLRVENPAGRARLRELSAGASWRRRRSSR